MHVLFVVPPFPGHLFASLPVARALVKAGHRVTYAGHEPVRSYVAGDGIPFVEILQERDEPDAPRRPRLLPKAWHGRWDAVAQRRSQAAAEKATYDAFFDGGARQLAGDLGVDLVLVDHAWPFLALAFRRCGVPAAILSSWLPQVRRPGRPPLNSDVVADGSAGSRRMAARDWRRHLVGRRLVRRPRARLLGDDVDYFSLTRSYARRTGYPTADVLMATQLPAPMLRLPQLYLAPRAFDFDAAPDPLHLYVEPGTGPARPFEQDEPVDWAAIGDRPVLYASFGSQSRLYAGVPEFFGRLVDAFGALPQWHLLLVTGEGQDVAALDGRYPNVTVLSHASPPEILPRAAAVLNHAGLNSVREAMAHGLPQIVVPLTRQRDQHGNAARVLHHRLGVRLAVDAPTEQITEAVRQVFESTELRSTGRRFAGLIADGAADQSWITELERLARAT